LVRFEGHSVFADGLARLLARRLTDIESPNRIAPNHRGLSIKKLEFFLRYWTKVQLSAQTPSGAIVNK
jgi:hypothetical protein